MWSFVASIVIFLGLIGGLGIWQRATRRQIREQAEATERQIAQAAEVAQRRFVQRYGHADPDLHRAITGTNGVVK